MARRGRSSRGRSSGGRSSSRSRGRSSSRSRSSGRKSSARSTRSSSSGRTARKTTTSRPRRTTRTVSPKARRATQRTSKATPRTVRRTAVVRTVSPPKPRRLSGIGRIASPATKFVPFGRQTNYKPVRYNPLIHKSPRGKLDAQGRIMGGFFSPRQQTSLQQRQTNFTQLMSGSGRPVTVTFANGSTRRLNLSDAAIRTYQQAGLKVQPISMTYSGGQKYPTPAIPRINYPSKAWTDPQNQNQLHVTQQMKVKPNTRTNSNFGGLGANPWNPVQALQGLFGISPQEQPASQWLPQRNENIINPDRPVYTAMATGLQQAAAYEQTPQGFQSQIMGTGAYNPTDISATDRIGNLFQNPLVLYGGLAIAGIVVLKLILGGGKQVVYR
jgi:hypothetical protein